jgi:hypothetical protein
MVDKYVVPLVPPVFRDGGVTGTDLYAARCGVLHTSSAASKKGIKALPERFIIDSRAGLV